MLIIGKKQIVLSCLTLMLAVAVYINYFIAQQPDNEAAPVGNAQFHDNAAVSVGEFYGEAAFVNDEGGNLPADDFFAQARLEKLTSRDVAIQTLQTILGGGDITEYAAVTHAFEAIELSNMIEKEGAIENMVKAQGIADCVVYLDTNSAKVVVKTDGLDKGQAAAIKDIILSEVAVDAENIRIFEVP